VASDLIDSYRIVVGMLLDHVTPQGGTDGAVAGFLASDQIASDVPRRMIEAQRAERRERN
jgi:hypothetical protein